MSVQEGKVILRTALDEELIMQLKIAALQAKVNPNVIVDAALRLYLSDQTNLDLLKGDVKKRTTSTTDQDVDKQTDKFGKRSLKLA